MEDEFVEPTRKPYDDLAELYQLMQDPDSNDQFIVTYDERRMTHTFLNKRPEVLFTDSEAKGVWPRSHKLRHDQVDNLQFSPNERYFVTDNGRRSDSPSTVIVH